MWMDKLKDADVSIHVIATGAGAGLSQFLWQIPGSSAYLSGVSFPYDQSETEELLGFIPEQFVSQETAVDLASAAYMKAFKFGGKKPIGIGVTASVASERAHRGDHRVDICVMTDDKVLSRHLILEKGVGFDQRIKDGKIVDSETYMLMFEALDISITPPKGIDASELAKERFMLRPFFTMDGKRHHSLVGLARPKLFALMPGAFNPPHEGHLGIADSFENDHGRRVVFEVTATPPHKAALSIQDLLKRAKLLQGRDRLFSTNIPMYLDKARAFPGMPLLLGADAMARVLDPKWGLNITNMLKEFNSLGTTLYVAERLVNGETINCDNVTDSLTESQLVLVEDLIQDLPGRWDISSTELRNKNK